MRRIALLLVVFALIGFVACNDDDAVTTTTTVAPTTTSTATSTTTEVPTTTTEAPTTTSTTVPETTTTTLPIWAITPQWCDENALPGSHVARDVLGDTSGVHELVFTFIRILEVSGYETVVFSAESELGPGSWEVRYWKVRASVLEQNGETIEGEFLLGNIQLVQRDPVLLEVMVSVSELTGRRVPFDDCPIEYGNRQSLMGANRVSIPSEDVANDVLEVGHVYPVSLITECSAAVDVRCPFLEDETAYNRLLFEHLAYRDYTSLALLQGQGWIWRIFMPAGWYDLSDYYVSG